MIEDFLSGDLLNLDDFPDQNTIRFGQHPLHAFARNDDCVRVSDHRKEREADQRQEPLGVSHKAHCTPMLTGVARCVAIVQATSYNRLRTFKHGSKIMVRASFLTGFVLVGLVTNAAGQDKLPDAPIPAREAPLRMTVPDGFKVTLFAGEPDVVQPIAFTFDDRGRLWVVECMSYPKWNKEPQPRAPGLGASGLGPEGVSPTHTAGPPAKPASPKPRGPTPRIDRRKSKDRVGNLEDPDGHGPFEQRTVFPHKLPHPPGLRFRFGGIWLCSIPNLIYIPFEK